MNILKQCARIPRIGGAGSSVEAFNAMTKAEFSGSVAVLNAEISSSHGTLGRQDYEWYVRDRSPEWQRRGALYKRYYGHCQRGSCRSTTCLSLNHLHYRTLGCENVAGDVELICKRHHKIYHDQQTRIRQYNECPRVWHYMENM